VTDSLERLLRSLLEWIGPEPRPYDEVIDAWRTSCPRLPVWEEANERGFVRRHAGPDGTSLVAVAPAGREYLGWSQSGDVFGKETS
jgi:D-3-phosphoglycerate dehydrogenase